MTRLLLCGGLLALSVMAATAQESPGASRAAGEEQKGVNYSPYAGHRFPEQPYWGDEHVHTAWSVDAGMSGATLTPEDAVRFARGEEVVSTSGQPVRLSRPLDWIAVTDHSDALGWLSELRRGNPELMSDPVQKRWRDMMNGSREERTRATFEVVAAQSNGRLPAAVKDPRFARSIWEQSTAIMEQYYQPGRFTTLIGFEWSSNAGGGDNLHRNVIYRDGKERADQLLPMTTFQSENPEDLWKWMEAWEKKTGGRLLAIPHNGNLSNGRMFERQTFLGKPLTTDWARERQRWEPLYEVIQMKGQGEAHPGLSTSDEFVVGYELWDRGNLILAPKQPGMLRGEYLRQALKDGLAIEQQLGANPFKYGMVGGTDTHNGLANAEEDNFFGKLATSEPRADRLSADLARFGGDRIVKNWEMTSAGYTAVWANANTREALWDAMKRKETYATSGPRMIVRLFGGYDFAPADVRSRNVALTGYTKGVPMGADLARAPAGKAPTFLVAALKDSIGANLDRIQIVKGWVDAGGELHEKIYDVVWSDSERRPRSADGKVPAVGNTVDVASATWSNTIGAPELVAVWQDPDFDAGVKAFYYARVLEIPTPRWTAYDAARYRVGVDPAVPMITQERAFTSPIWYSP